jgi:hypothetical protein
MILDSRAYLPCADNPRLRRFTPEPIGSTPPGLMCRILSSGWRSRRDRAMAPRFLIRPQRPTRMHQPSSRHPLLWWGMNSTVFGKYPLDQHPELHGALSRALNARESTYGNPIGCVTPTRSASFPTEVNNALTWFACIPSLSGGTSPGPCLCSSICAVSRPQRRSRSRAD